MSAYERRPSSARSARSRRSVASSVTGVGGGSASPEASERVVCWRGIGTSLPLDLGACSPVRIPEMAAARWRLRHALHRTFGCSGASQSAILDFADSLTRKPSRLTERAARLTGHLEARGDVSPGLLLLPGCLSPLYWRPLVHRMHQSAPRRSPGARLGRERARPS